MRDIQLQSTSRVAGKPMPTNQPRRCRYEREEASHCKANAQTSSEFCFFHDPALVKDRAAARRAGGIARTRKIVLPNDLPVKRLQTVAEVVELLGETINQLRRGEIDLRVSNAIGYLSSILLNAIEKSSFEERLDALEAAVANPRPSNSVDSSENRSFDFVQHNAAGGSCSDDQTKTTDPN
jgi:hypothetical protein